MGTIKIGSSANRKGITIEPSVVLFNGNNVKKIMSGVITIWQDIKALVPTMTSNNTPYGVASASSEFNTNYPAYHVFDNKDTTFWQASTKSASVQYKFTTPSCIQKVKFTPLKGRVKTYKIQASNDGSTWDDLTNTLSCENVNTEQNVDISNNSFYLYYKFNILSIHDQYYSALYSLQFYGTQS